MRSTPSPSRTLLMNPTPPELPPRLLPPLHPAPPLMQANPSHTPLLRPRHPHHPRGCVPAAVSHLATTPRPGGRTRPTLWPLRRALRRRCPAPQPSALLLRTSLRGWRGAVTEGRDSHLRTTHNPLSQVSVEKLGWWIHSQKNIDSNQEREWETRDRETLSERRKTRGSERWRLLLQKWSTGLWSVLFFWFCRNCLKHGWSLALCVLECVCVCVHAGLLSG